MELVIGPSSSNIEGSRVLSSKHRKGLSPILLRLFAQELPNNNWDIQAEWFPPKTKKFTLVDYSIEYQALSQSTTTWIPLSNTINLSQTISNAPPDAYKARVRANYAGFSSEWVEGQSINLFINVSFDFTNSFHALMV
jgi:hypothetical protein